MIASRLPWLETAIEHAQRVFNHATDMVTQQRAEWEVQVLDSWRHEAVENPCELVSHNIRPLVNRLRHNFDASRCPRECGLIEWQLDRLATWERHLSVPAPAARPYARLRY